MTNSAQPPQSAIDRIIGLYNEGQLKQAVSLAHNLCDQYPKALILYEILGAAYMGLKDADKIIENYKKALQINPNHTDAYNNMGMALYNQGKFAEAVKNYQKAIRLEPDFADAHYNLGNALKQNGELKKAIESYKTSLAINPNDADVLLNYGNALKAYGNFDQAIEVFTTVLSLDPNFAAAQINMDSAIEEKTEIEKNVADYSRITKLKMGSAEILTFTGTLFKARGYLDAAIDSYNEAIKIKPDYAEAHLNLGNAIRGKGGLSAAIKSYQYAINVEPEFAESYLNLGITLLEKGKIDTAIHNFKEALNVKPDYAEAYCNIGLALQKKGELDSAIESFKHALKIKPEFAEAYNNMGNAQNDIGDIDAAIHSFKEALKIKPNYAAAHNNMGNALRNNGDLKAAIDKYKHALKIEPDYAECFNNYNSLLIQVSDSFSLNEELQKFGNEMLVRLLDENPKHYILQSIMYFLKGNYEASGNSLLRYKILEDSLNVEYMNDKDKIFCSAYAHFIKHLIKKCLAFQSFNKNKIYHIGESHCLSYAHHSIQLGHQSFCVSPKIIIGGKAYHFSKSKNNGFKSIAQHNLNSIPKKSSVFISFGEIDCRINEGFITASQKNGISLSDIVQKTVLGYVKWFLDANAFNNHRYTFFNVPAPIYKKEFTLSENQRAAKVVDLFNGTLKINLEGSSCALIDVYGPTKAKNGFSNEFYHSDSIHLDCGILSIIQDQISKSKTL